MSLLPFFVVAFGSAAAALLVRQSARLSLAVGLAGLAGTTIAALAIAPGDELTLGVDGRLQATEFLRLFLVLGSATGLVTALVGLASAWPRDLPAALLGGFGALGLALAVGEPLTAVVALTAGALVGSLVSVAGPASARDVRIASREFRAIAVAATMAVIGMAWVARPVVPLGLDPALFGIAYLAVALATAVRFAAIPFHLWAARLADSAAEAALPLLLAWAPAGFAVVALTWMDRSIAPLLIPLDVERGLVVAIGAASIVLGAAAAWLQDDLEHVVGYSIIQDAGFIVLGLAILDPAAWQPARSWILVFVVVKTALAAWAAAMRSRFATRRIPELGGWARRSPLLGLGLLVIVVATIGLPGLLAWEVRGRLTELALGDGPLRVVVVVGGFAALAAYGRIALAGLRPITALVAAAPSDLLVRPPVGPEPRSGSDRAEAVALATWRANRAPIAGLGVLLLAVVALSVGGGWAGTAQAAAADAPEAGQPAETVIPGQTAPPSESPSESPSLSPSESPSSAPSGSPSAAPTGSASPRPSAAASGSPSPAPSASLAPSRTP